MTEAVTKKKPRRPKRMVDKAITIRPALPEDGTIVEQLMAEDGLIVQGLDWSTIDGSWLIAEEEGAVVGVVQVLPGRPLARVDALLVRHGLSNTKRGRIVHMLLRSGYALLHAMGAQVAMSVIDPRYPGFCCVAKRYGATSIGKGEVFAYPLGGMNHV